VKEVIPWGGKGGKEGEKVSVFYLCNVQGDRGQAERLAFLQKYPAKTEPSSL